MEYIFWKHMLNYVVCFFILGPTSFDDSSEVTGCNIRLVIIASTRCYSQLHEDGFVVYLFHNQRL
jgi:hypothetical protein